MRGQQSRVERLTTHVSETAEQSAEDKGDDRQTIFEGTGEDFWGSTGDGETVNSTLYQDEYETHVGVGRLTLLV
jgi:hypothetical protein